MDYRDNTQMIGISFILASFYCGVLESILPSYGWLDYALLAVLLFAVGMTGKLLFGNLGRKLGRYDSEHEAYLDAGVVGFSRTVGSTLFLVCLLKLFLGFEFSHA